MRTPSLILGLTLLASGSLSSPALAAKVKVHLGKGVDMANYKTYRWLPPRMLVKTGIDENNPANPALKEVVGRQLAQKGLTEVAEGGDLLIQAWVLTASVPQLEAVLIGEGPNMDFGTVMATMGRYNREGTLCLNLIDSRTKKFAWFAMVTDSLKRGPLSQEEIRARFEKAAQQLFKKYPVKK